MGAKLTLILLLLISMAVMVFLAWAIGFCEALDEKEKKKAAGDRDPTAKARNSTTSTYAYYTAEERKNQ